MRALCFVAGLLLVLLYRLFSPAASFGELADRLVGFTLAVLVVGVVILVMVLI